MPIFNAIREIFSRSDVKEVAATCCSITSLDELANAANPNNTQSNTHGAHSQHDIIENPFNANGAEAVLGPLVMYLGIGGLFISKNIYSDFHDKSKNYKKIQKEIEKKIVQLLKTPEGERTPEQKQAADAYYAYISHLKIQRREANFQKHWAGIVSGASSATIAVGQVVTPLSPIALYGLTAVGAAHMRDMHRLGNENKQKIERAHKTAFKAKSTSTGNLSREESTRLEIDRSEAEIRKEYYKKKQKRIRINEAAWGLFTGGAAILATAQLSMLGASFVAPPALVATGVTGLTAGIAGTVVYNNILTRSDNLAGMPKHAHMALEKEGHAITHEQIKQHNIHANEMRLLAKDYRHDFWKERDHGASILHGLQRTRQKFLAYTTLGLVPAFAHKMKHKDKARVAAHATESMDSRRLAMLSQLTNLEKTIPTYQSSQDSFENGYPKDDDIGISPNSLESSSELAKLFGELYKSDHYQGVVKILRKYITEERKVKNNEGKTTKKLCVKDKYRFLFPEDALGDNKTDQQTDLEWNLHQIGQYAGCCRPDAESRVVLGFIQKKFCSNSTKPKEAEYEKAKELLKKAVDHYLLFELRHQAKDRVAIWSELSDAFERTAEGEKEREEIKRETEKKAEKARRKEVKKAHTTEGAPQEERSCCRREEGQVPSPAQRPTKAESCCHQEVKPHQPRIGNWLTIRTKKHSVPRQAPSPAQRHTETRSHYHQEARPRQPRTGNRTIANIEQFIADTDALINNTEAFLAPRTQLVTEQAHRVNNKTSLSIAPV